ncbi:hypothetical protein DL96DRAFT_1628505 [Flagelloscypha sp. PMI_526]|nr:hypothetical protein DL96DRAFT_1628505 [Flagelloscypha sp. PMI_526]
MNGGHPQAILVLLISSLLASQEAPLLLKTFHRATGARFIDPVSAARFKYLRLHFSTLLNILNEATRLSRSSG